MDTRIVCGDIGGTKALLGIAAVAARAPRFVFRRRYACADFASFAALFARFRSDADAHAAGVRGACLAVAGPVDDGGLTAKITNLPWTVDAVACGAAFGLAACALVNDFAAAAAGIAAVAPADLVTLQAGAPIAAGVRLVVGAGTGLGMATLVPQEGEFIVLPGEGGHVGFSPQDDEQARILAALRLIHGRVTTERVVSGPGLAAIHRIFAAADVAPAAIAERALAGDAAARRSVDAFVAAYGAYAGDMALAVMARGGVFLAGGIAAKILPLMQSGVFTAAFNAKAEHAALAARMPVHVVTDGDLGLKGAALIGAAALRR
ncbi:MAG: glucokinase [Rhodocyclaceae bacterium]|nr:glucokinase [Rhodocyclaceae bacterium]